MLLPKAKRRAIQNPSKTIKYANRRFLKPTYYELYRRIHSIERQKDLIHRFIDRDEFILVVLDACRYDEFARIYRTYLDGEPRKVWAAGRWTAEYVSRTWSGTYNLTYINSAPVISDIYFEKNKNIYNPSEHFLEIVDVWDTHWDPDLETIPAEAVTRTALEYAQERPTRMVVHYMQPHVPYVGGEGDRMSMSEADLDAETIAMEDANNPTYELLERIESGELTDEDVLRLYRQNLEYVLEHVMKLVRRVACPVVITSDHGEHLGENGKYLHESDSTLIRQIPWLVVPSHEVGTKLGESLDHENRSRSEEVNDDFKDQLEKLGYF